MCLSLSDVFTLSCLLTAINVSNEFDQENNEMTLDATGPVSTTADYDFVSKMQASIVGEWDPLGSLWSCTSGDAELYHRDSSLTSISEL